MRSASETRAGVYLGSTSIALLQARERDALGLLRSRARVRTRTGRSNGIPIAARTGAAAVGGDAAHGAGALTAGTPRTAVALHAARKASPSSAATAGAFRPSVRSPAMDCDARQRELQRIAMRIISHCTVQSSPIKLQRTAIVQWTAMHSIAASVREVRCGERRDASA